MCISLTRFLLLVTIVGPAASRKEVMRRQQYRDHMAVVGASSSITSVNEQDVEHVEDVFTPNAEIEAADAGTGDEETF